jgi:hypothetical protein
MGDGAAEISDLAWKGGLVVLVKPGIDQELALIINIFLPGDMDFLVTHKGLIPRSGVKKIPGGRHVEHAEYGPEIF